MDDLTSGTTKQQELNLGTILELPLPIPPLAEQERIVAKLDEVLPLIDQLAELESDREYLDRKFAKAIERAIFKRPSAANSPSNSPKTAPLQNSSKPSKPNATKLEKEGKIKKQKPTVASVQSRRTLRTARDVGVPRFGRDCHTDSWDHLPGVSETQGIVYWGCPVSDHRVGAK